MIRFAVVGTNWITKQFVDAAHETGNINLPPSTPAASNRRKPSPKTIRSSICLPRSMNWHRAPDVDAVYIASPNSLHFPQTRLFLSHKKHVICEKPLASNLQEVEAAIALAKENNVVLFEAFKTASLPNFLLLKETLAKVGKLRKAFINYCQYSSRYQRYLDGENPNTFNPAFSNGSIMDIGFYCPASARGRAAGRSCHRQPAGQRRRRPAPWC
ncbi:1,5-anhydro-D-fructose reductase [Klebsiella pneumoniae]|uniref:Gfo/Idh/MocA family protein n=1 Tax=Klebsiella pneumoniae TaxID=573 RepID=UPI000F0D202F|nr:Gfo/Idh/MocA family oxidoreductase [Klebsiella pneumoniae]VDA26792.1 1,5-anhydro-D-fructose reductase [Klebsiella pneumoniae]